MQEATKFIILFPPRSGSTLIMSALNRHKDIFCGPEIFNSAQKHRGRYAQIDVELPLNERIDLVFDSVTLEKSVFGFKLAYTQLKFNPDLLDILKEDKYRIIHTHRKRSLERMVSLELAQKSGVWSKTIGSDEKTAYDELTMTLPRQTILDFMRIDQENLDKYRSMFSEDFDYFETNYDKLIGDSQNLELMKIQEFLGVDIKELSPHLAKQNNRELRDIIINYEEIKNLEEVEIV